MPISPGTHVEVTTARGERIEMVAQSAPTSGHTIRIVWVSDLEEYERAGTEAHQLPWPADSLTPI